jgi:hypothetical protein
VRLVNVPLDGGLVHPIARYDSHVRQVSIASRLRVTLAALTALLAYIDPGTGSLLLQAILGGIAAVGVGFKVFWGRLRNVFRLGARNERPPEGDVGPPA